MFHRCGDCIFSGHAVVLTLFSLYYFWKSDNEDHCMLFRILKRCSWFVSLIGMFLILANRSHYTVDILLAVYVSAGVWWSYAYWWKTFIIDKGRLKAIVNAPKSKATIYYERKVH